LHDNSDYVGLFTVLIIIFLYTSSSVPRISFFSGGGGFKVKFLLVIAYNSMVSVRKNVSLRYDAWLFFGYKSIVNCSC